MKQPLWLQNFRRYFRRRLHPLFFQKTFFRVLPIFFLPLIQVFLSGGSPSDYLLGGSLVLLVYFFLLWQQSRWQVTRLSYAYRHGLFLRRTYILRRSWSLLPSRETSPLSFFTGAVFFDPGVPGWGKLCLPLFKKSLPHPSAPHRRKWRRASIPKALLSAALLSNPASGLLLATIFFRSASSLLGQEIALRLVNAADQRVRLIALGIPPAIAGISWLFLAGWLVSFLRESVALLPFSWEKHKKRIFFRFGLWPRREAQVSLSSIGSVALLQTLPMALLGIYRAEGYLQGGGRMILHPALGRKERPALLRLGLLPDFSEKDLRPHRGAWFSFLWLPAVIFLVLLLLEQRMLPFLDFLLPVFPLLLLPAVWFFAIRLLGYCCSGLTMHHGQVCIRGVRVFTLFGARIDPTQITGVQYLQNPAQRITGRCTLVLQTTGGWMARYKLCHISKQEAENWIREHLGIFSDL